MAEIINIDDKTTRKEAPPEPNGKHAAYCWTCSACGNSTFQLLRGGSIRCANCLLACFNLAHFRPDGKAD